MEKKTAILTSKNMDVKVRPPGESLHSNDDGDSLAAVASAPAQRELEAIAHLQIDGHGAGLGKNSTRATRARASTRPARESLCRQAAVRASTRDGRRRELWTTRAQPWCPVCKWFWRVLEKSLGMPCPHGLGSLGGGNFYMCMDLYSSCCWIRLAS